MFLNLKGMGHLLDDLYLPRGEHSQKSIWAGLLVGLWELLYPFFHEKQCQSYYMIVAL